jgi:cobalamin-dependent methionine synthase I
MAVAKKIIERAMDHGIPREDVLIDPLVMPIGAMRYAGRQVFEIVRRCRDELKVNTCCGASNVSFGLPNRGPAQRDLPGDGHRRRADLGHHQSHRGGESSRASWPPT